MIRMVVRFQTWMRAKEGQGMAEYALILALVAIVAILGLRALGPRIRELFNDIVGNLNTY